MENLQTAIHKPGGRSLRRMTVATILATFHFFSLYLTVLLPSQLTMVLHTLIPKEESETCSSSFWSHRSYFLPTSKKVYSPTFLLFLFSAFLSPSLLLFLSSLLSLNCYFLEKAFQTLDRSSGYPLIPSPLPSPELTVLIKEHRGLWFALILSFINTSLKDTRWHSVLVYNADQSDIEMSPNSNVIIWYWNKVL